MGTVEGGWGGVGKELGVGQPTFKKKNTLYSHPKLKKDITPEK